MKKWSVAGRVVGSQAVQVEAETAEEAKQAAEEQANVSFCWHCASNCEDAYFEAIEAQEIE